MKWSTAKTHVELLALVLVGACMLPTAGCVGQREPPERTETTAAEEVPSATPSEPEPAKPAHAVPEEPQQEASETQEQAADETVSHPQTRLIPRTVLFGNPEMAAARLSSDGKHLSYLAPVEGVLNVWVGPVDDPQAAKPVTQDRRRGVRRYFWAYTGRHILYTQDAEGDENWHVYATDIETGETNDLTPLDGVQARIVGVSEQFPNEILVGLNQREPRLHDVYRVNLTTGKRELVTENPGFAALMADDNYQVRLAVTYAPDGGQILLKPDAKEGWSELLRVSSVDAMTTSPLAFDKSGQKLFMIDSRQRNTAALVELDLQSAETRTLAEDARADADGVMIHPTKHHVQAVSFTYDRSRWEVLDSDIAEDIKRLSEAQDGEFQVTSRTLDDRQWTVAYIVDDGPLRFYRYDRSTGKLTFLFASRSGLEPYRFAKMHPEVIPARDGLELVSYLTLPSGSDTDGNARPEVALPLVLLVHGGPWARDEWGYSPQHQWLANRGYAVLSVNFRGSTGFGKKFINAANGQWAGKMHDDLLDAVDWAVKQGVARREAVAIMGGSYGGYATLVGLTFTPEVFACGVDIVGPSSLVTLLENVPPYWGPFMPVMKERVGDHTTDQGRRELLARSPLNFVDRIERPLLIGQGANDPRVKRGEADQIVAAMEKRQIPVTYVLYPDEGHGFARPENRMSFNAVVEAFLAEHLGGRFEPVGNDFAGSRIEVPTGAEGVPGLQAALRAHQANQATTPAEEPLPVSNE